MDFNDLQIIWNEEAKTRAFTIDEAALQRSVEKKANSFLRTIFARDLREVVIGIALIVLFTTKGFMDMGTHAAYLTVANFLVSAGLCYILAHLLLTRHFQKQKENRMDDSTLLGNLKRHHSQLSFQVRLLRNIFWWYLLPLIPGMALPYFFEFREMDGGAWSNALFIAAILVGVYYLNRHCSRYLDRQREDAEKLLEKLTRAEETE